MLYKTFKKQICENLLTKGLFDNLSSIEEGINDTKLKELFDNGTTVDEVVNMIMPTNCSICGSNLNYKSDSWKPIGNMCHTCATM